MYKSTCSLCLVTHEYTQRREILSGRAIHRKKKGGGGGEGNMEGAH